MSISRYIFLIFLFILGSVEVILNIYHLTRGSRQAAVKSAKKQHGEIPKNLPEGHYIVKAYIMIGFGMAFIAGVLMSQVPIITFIILGLFGAYGIIQVIVYKAYWATIPSAIVYNVPLVLFVCSR